MVTIAVDAMGGDHAPSTEVDGAIRAARSLGVKVILVGREDALREELSRHEDASALPIQIVHASERVTMEDSAAKAVRGKRDSSIRVACRLVRDGVAAGPGLGGQHRRGHGHRQAGAGHAARRGPARAGVRAFPTLTGRPAVMVDVGANVDCTPRMLAQFAVMGEIYSRVIFHTENPRVGLLSIGEEEHKGNELTRKAYALLKTPAPELHRQCRGAATSTAARPTSSSATASSATWL